MAESARPVVWAAFAFAVVLIGLNFVAVRLSNVELAPTWGAAARFGLAAIAMVGLVSALRITWPRGKALVGAALFGALQFGAFFGFMYWGLVEVQAGVASIISATIPLLTFVIAVLARVERFHASAIVGGVLVIAGIAVLVDARTAAAPWPRLVAVCFAALSAAGAGVVVKAFPRSHPLAVNAVGMVVAFVMLLAVSALRQEPWTLPEADRTWLAFAYLVVSSLVLFPLIVWIIGEWTASATAYAMVLAPLVAVPVGAMVLGEAVSGGYALAGVLVAAGVYAGTAWRPRRRASIS